LVPPVAGEPVTNWDQWRQLENIESAKRNLSPEAMTSFPGFGGPGPTLGPLIHAWNVNRNFWGSQASKLSDMRPTQEEYLRTQEAKRRALLGR
jgi:hypothetical protein